MDAEYIQAQRYKLQKRFRRLHSARPNAYTPALRYFWQFIRDHELFADVTQQLEAKEPGLDDTVSRIVEQDEDVRGSTETEAAAIGLGLLRYCADSEGERPWQNIAIHYGAGRGEDEWAQYFTEVLIEPFYEYLDEEVDDRGATLALIRRYKRRAEWFERDRLFNLWNEDTSKGEALLAEELYRYLYDQGLEFTVEPKSASGRVDLIAAQQGERRLLADAKVFNADDGRGRSYLADGVRQLYDYCVDFQQPIGYLVVFKTSNHDLAFVTERQDSQVTRLRYNHKTLFLLQIDLYPHEESASEHGQLEPYEVTEEDLLGEIESKD